MTAAATNSPRQSSFRNGKNKSPAEKKKKGKDKSGDKKINSTPEIEVVPNEVAGVSYDTLCVISTFTLLMEAFILSSSFTQTRKYIES